MLTFTVLLCCLLIAWFDKTACAIMYCCYEKLNFLSYTPTHCSPFFSLEFVKMFAIGFIIQNKKPLFVLSHALEGAEIANRGVNPVAHSSICLMTRSMRVCGFLISCLWPITPFLRTSSVSPILNRPFATNDNMVQIPPCWRASSLLGSLRFDDGNINDNATNQWFDWLNEEK